MEAELPMSMRERLENDLKKALKEREALRVSCLRMLKAKVMEKEVSLRAKQGIDYRLSDDEIVQVASAYAKQRRDSIESYRKGSREDLASKEEAELAIVEEYLPQQLSREEIAEIVRRAVEESGASSPKDMGAVMKLVMPEVKGAADGKLVNQIVREALAPPEPPDDQAAQT
jgi:uncharacterized protein YqeY